ncbi:hypothetical protein MRB53_029729 [Persea americana]|uniref:Uncharacterized protein n=1 Tax=Persea americana TaxID=3435 RepID=A0ACC2KJ52_PERAE|nr:hypothetical protein MRB53_029729 [Persea americana]
MGSISHVLFLLLILIPIFVFSNFHLMSGTWDLKQRSSIQGAAEHSSLELNWVGEDGDGNGQAGQIEKVSGEDATRKEAGMLVLEKFIRVLLGLKSYNKRPVNKHGESSLSPAPAPSYEAVTPAPAPAPSPSTHVHPHVPRSPHLNLILPHPHKPAVASRTRIKSRVSRRIIIVVAVSSGAAILIVLLILVLLCWRPRRCRKKILRRMRLGSGIGYSLGRSTSKLVNSHNSVRKVSFDPVPELFYQNSLGLFPEHLSCLKQSHETTHINVSSNTTTVNSPSQEGTSTGEPNRCESGSERGSSAHRIDPRESLSSDDDESFHSVCGSHSSVVQLSNVSEANCSNLSITSSPSYVSNGPPSPDHNNFKDHTLPSPMNSPTPPMIPDSAPLYPLNLNSSSSSPCNSKQTTGACTSSSQNIISLDCPPSSPSHCATPGPAHNQASIPDTAKPDFATELSSGVQPSPLHPSLRSRQMPSVAPCLTSYSRNSYSISNSNLDSSSSFPPPPPLPSWPSLSTIQNKSFPKTLHKSPPLPPLPPPPQPSAVPLIGSKGSIPQPPCPPLPPPMPPSLLKGHGSIQQPPPPPPFRAQQLTPLGKDGAPLRKLKPLHWDKVRATPDRSMVWDKLRSSSFELDEESMESLFGYNLRSSMKNEEVKSKSPSPSKNVLDHKRLQNITILSKALNATAEHVCEALLKGDGLCAQQLEALVKMVPTKEEEDKLSNYQGDMDELGSAEKFVKAMLNIPFAFQRIEAMLYRDTFEDEVVHLRKSFAMLEEACKELRSSRLFLKLLEAVLKTGNRMNVGTIRGGARAFKLDALLKLADVKGTDGKTTLLHFVVQEMIRSEGVGVSETTIEKTNQETMHKTVEEREHDYRMMGLDLVSGLSTELCNVKKTATVDLDVLASSVSNLSDGMVKLQHLVQKDLSTDERRGRFIHSMKSFLYHAEKNIRELKEDEDRVLLHVREITEYFHGHVSKDEANPLRIFVIVRDFLGMLDREVRSLKAQNIQSPANPFR